MWIWRKLASAKWEDAWEERLAHLPAERLVMIRPANSKMLRLEAYLDTKKEAAALEKMFGGKVLQSPRTFVQTEQEGRLLHFGPKLSVASDTSVVPKNQASRTLIIPAAMAFGTGEHATTAMCLRMLLRRIPKAPGWSFADLGCGTGIFALAARKLGAGTVFGIDNDPHAVRSAKNNASMNELRGIKWSQDDVLTWQPPSPLNMIAANLFSSLLVQCSPLLHSGLLPRGLLICSGLLKTQEAEVSEALEKVGFQRLECKRRGKWVAMVWQRG